MKIRTSIKIGVCITALSVFAIVACHKSSNSTTTSTSTPTSEQSGMTVDNAQIDNANSSILTTTDAAINGGASNMRTTSGCASTIITFDSTTVGGITTHTATINFGTGCTGWDGRTKSGEIIVTWTGRYKDSGSVHTITFNNFYWDGYRIGGSKTVTNMGSVPGGSITDSMWYKVRQNDSFYVTSDSVTTKRATRTRTWNTGRVTITPEDDTYLIAGADTLTRANGKVYYYTITTPLLVGDCKWIRSGIATVTSPSLSNTWTINYGDGSCNAWATLTVDGHSYIIHLR